MYASLADLKKDISQKQPNTLVQKWLSNPKSHAFASIAAEEKFYDMIRTDWHHCEKIKIVGSGNWRFSLNPFKNFSEFSVRSDIDVVVISRLHFHETWEELRQVHRTEWLGWDKDQQTEVLETGKNVYAGFITPSWIPKRQNPLRFKYVTTIQKYSCNLVGFRKVSFLFFKDIYETIDYYSRGINSARRHHGL